LYHFIKRNIVWQKEFIKNSQLQGKDLLSRKMKSMLHEKVHKFVSVYLSAAEMAMIVTQSPPPPEPTSSYTEASGAVAVRVEPARTDYGGQSIIMMVVQST